MPHASCLMPHASCLLLQPTMQATNGSAKTPKRPRRSISAIRTSLLLTCLPQILANHASDQRKRQNPQTTAVIHQCDTHRYAPKKKSAQNWADFAISKSLHRNAARRAIGRTHYIEVGSRRLSQKSWLAGTSGVKVFPASRYMVIGSSNTTDRRVHGRGL